MSETNVRAQSDLIDVKYLNLWGEFKKWRQIQWSGKDITSSSSRKCSCYNYFYSQIPEDAEEEMRQRGGNKSELGPIRIVSRKISPGNWGAGLA